MDPNDGVVAPDTITITEHQTQELQAKGADLRCACTTHRRPVTPSAIRALQEGLEREGFSRGCLTVQNITHTSDFSGCLGAVVIAAIAAAGVVAWLSLESLSVALPIIAASAAALATLAWFVVRSTQYSFVIRCADAAAVERALEVVARVGEGVAVNATDWRYEIDSATLGDWAIRCIGRANARAQRVAEALGVTIVGVHAYEESHELPQRAFTGPDAGPAVAERAEAPVAAPRKSAAAESSTPAAAPVALAGSERGGAHVTVRYRVAGYESKAATPTVETNAEPTAAPPARDD